MSGSKRAGHALVASLLAWPHLAQAAPRAYDGPRAVASRGDVSAVSVATVDDEASGPAHEQTAPPSAPAVAPPSVVPPPEVAPRAEPHREVRLRLALDLAITLGAAAPSFALGLWVEPTLPDVMGTPGAEPDVGRFDALALGRYEEAPAIASDVLLALSIAAPLGYHAIEAALHQRGYSRIRGRGFFARYGTDLVLMAEAIAINGLMTQILKAAIRRPRPYTYLLPEDVDPELRQDLLDAQNSHSADWAFPSGHTSTAFVATSAGATLLTLELLGRKNWAVALAWVGGTGIAATTGIMRVMSGRHFPSDVVTSALIGTGIGVAVPLAHWKPTTPGDRADFRGVMRSWAVRPMGGRNVVGLQLGGVLP